MLPTERWFVIVIQGFRTVYDVLGPAFQSTSIDARLLTNSAIADSVSSKRHRSTSGFAEFVLDTSAPIFL